MCGWGPYAREASVWEACCRYSGVINMIVLELTTDHCMDSRMVTHAMHTEVKYVFAQPCTLNSGWKDSLRIAQDCENPSRFRIRYLAVP